MNWKTVKGMLAKYSSLVSFFCLTSASIHVQPSYHVTQSDWGGCQVFYKFLVQLLLRHFHSLVI
jgi:hypothetical protein